MKEKVCARLENYGAFRKVKSLEFDTTCENTTS